MTGGERERPVRLDQHRVGQNGWSLPIDLPEGGDGQAEGVEGGDGGVGEAVLVERGEDAEREADQDRQRERGQRQPERVGEGVGDEKPWRSLRRT